MSRSVVRFKRWIPSQRSIDKDRVGSITKVTAGERHQVVFHFAVSRRTGWQQIQIVELRALRHGIEIEERAPDGIARVGAFRPRSE